MIRPLMLAATGMLLGAVLTQAAPPNEDAGGSRDELKQRARKLIERGAEYLLSTQEDNGGWVTQSSPGVTCLILRGLIQAPDYGPQHPAVRRGLNYVLDKCQRESGGIHTVGSNIQNYETAIALSMLAATKDPRFAPRIKAAQQFLIDNQWDENEGRSIDDAWYGGAGYGHSGRPDLSNTQIMLDALHDSGLPKDHPTYQKALVFIARCQMLGETNSLAFAKGSTDGGFIYSTNAGGETKAGKVESGPQAGELRTYGSMTYAGYKSMLYCDASKTDPRVQAAREWISRNWTLDANPNMPAERKLEGLYYYYQTFARAMEIGGEDQIRDASGVTHDWRAELVAALEKRQRRDGSWLNEADRWMEGIPQLTTAYALLALEQAFAEPKPEPRLAN